MTSIKQNDYNIETFNPITANEADFKKLFELLDDLFLEQEKDDPLPSKEFRLKNFKRQNPEFNLFWWLVWNTNKEVIGFSLLSMRTKEATNYEENKHIAFFQYRIKKEYRNQEISLAIINKVLKKLEEFEIITILQTNTSFEFDFELFDKLNGILALEGAENRCRLDNVDLKLMKEWKKQGEEKGKSESRYLQWFEDCPEDIIEEFCNVYTEALNQQPLGELEVKAKITPKSRRKSEQEIKELGYDWHTVITRENDGSISGITDIRFNHDRPYRIEQQLTGVKM